MAVERLWGVGLNADSFCKGVPDGWVGRRAEQAGAMNGSKSDSWRPQCQGRVKRLAGNGPLSEETYPVSEPFTFVWEGWGRALE
ncbi:hypothetical protein SSAG_02063 [Streptomyces sp. Mg1]|nr:hypothetical protein SSAG_02063 [Streptomyces sp. Mg1]